MTRLSACLLVAPVLLTASAAAPLAAQEQSGSFTLPEPTPTPTPAPAGPADERGGVTIPPRAQPTATPTVTPAIQPTATPSPRPTASPSAAPDPILPRTPAPAPGQPAPAVPAPSAAPAPQPDPASPEASPPASEEPLALPPVAGLPEPDAPRAQAAPEGAAAPPASLPAWWPFAAGGLGALALLGGGALLWRRRKPAPLQIAPPLAVSAAGAAPPAEPARVDLTFEIISATRSVMMFTVEYRLTIANRSARAVTELNLAVQLACARASAGNAPSAGAAQALGTMARVGPHQARSTTGTLQLPLSAIRPLRQGTTPLFVPLAHVTLDGVGLQALTRSFVIGTPSGTGRVHPILLDQPPGAIPGLVAQAIALPPVPAAA